MMTLCFIIDASSLFHRHAKLAHTLANVCADQVWEKSVHSTCFAFQNVDGPQYAGPMFAYRLELKLRTLARWDSDHTSVDLKGARVRGAYVIDHGRWEVMVGDCSGAGAAIGLPDAVPCAQQRGNFTIPNSVYFNGKM